MQKWRADKELDLLGRIGQLLVQTKRALLSKENKIEFHQRLIECNASTEEQKRALEESQSAHRELSLKREELAVLIGSVGVASSNGLRQELCSLDEAITDVCERVLNTKERRTEQLKSLDDKIEIFNKVARSEIESISA